MSPRSSAHNRRLLTPGRARYYFIQYPHRSDAEWARVWGCSRERVRQLRIEADVPTRTQVKDNSKMFVREFYRLRKEQQAKDAALESET